MYGSQTKRTKLEDPKLVDPYHHLPSNYPIAHRPWSPSKGGSRYPNSGGSANSAGSGQHYSLEPHPQPAFKLEKFEEDKFSNYSTSPAPGSRFDRYKDSPYSVIPKKKYLEEHERFPTLADEISRIKTALDGAPVHAKEAVLKILERLTARVDRAEREKEDAVTRFRELTLKYGLLEDELAKKRGELRELLRQDLKPGSGTGTADDDAKPSSDSSSNPSPLKLVKESKLLEEKASSADPSSTECTVLPKITLKSPAKIMEELNVPSSTRSEAGSVDRDEDQDAQPSASSPTVSSFILSKVFY